MNRIHDYDFFGCHPGVKGILLFIFVLLPIPALLEYVFLAGSSASNAYPYLLLLGLLGVPYGIYKDLKFRDWYQAIQLDSGGILVSKNTRIPWSDIKLVEEIKKSDEDYFVFSRKSIRVRTNDGLILRVFSTISEFPLARAEIMRQFYNQMEFDTGDSD